jgi:transcriptional regulator with XRE-family HTH domain
MENEHDLRHILSANIRSARKRRRLTQTQLAIYADISLSYMTDIERCKTWISDKTLIKIAQALGTSPWKLLYPPEEASESPGAAGKSRQEEETDALREAVRDIKQRILKEVNRSIIESLADYEDPKIRHSNRPRAN